METGLYSLPGIFSKIKLLPACPRIGRCRAIEEYFLQETWEQEFLLWRTLTWEGSLMPRLRSQKGSDHRQKGSHGLAWACCFCCQVELAVEPGALEWFRVCGNLSGQQAKMSLDQLVHGAYILRGMTSTLVRSYLNFSDMPKGSVRKTAEKNSCFMM